MLLYFSTLVMLPIEKVTAISFVVPLIVTVLAVFFLGEKIYIYRTLALILGFGGMLIIIRPGIIDISKGVYMALFSSFLSSLLFSSLTSPFFPPFLYSFLPLSLLPLLSSSLSSILPFFILPFLLSILS